MTKFFVLCYNIGINPRMKSSVFTATKIMALLSLCVSLLHTQLMAVDVNVAPTITVTPASAPNVFGSPSYPGWVSNANSALLTGATSNGTPGTPTYYQQAPVNMSVSDNIVTGYNSWKGDANPTVTYGAAFGSELGNRLLFGVLINGNGTQFSISQLSFNAVSTDPTSSLSFGFGAGSYNYSNDYWGILYGPNGVLGGGDDIYITGGPNTQLVDAIVGRGSGNAWASYLTDPGVTNQDKLNGVIASIGTEPFSFTGTYSLGAVTGSATVYFNSQSTNSVPDQGSTIALLGAALISVFYVRRYMLV